MKKRLIIVDAETGEEVEGNGYRIVQESGKGDYYKVFSLVMHDAQITDGISITPLLSALAQRMNRETNIITFSSSLTKEDIGKSLGISKNAFYQRLKHEKTQMTIVRISPQEYMINPHYITKQSGRGARKLQHQWNEFLANQVKTQAQRKVLEERKKARNARKISKNLKLVKIER